MERRVLTALGLVLCLLLSACSNLVSVEPTGEAIGLDRPIQTSVVTDAGGGLLAEFHAEQDRELLALDAVAETAREAVIAVEDARFFEHSGVDARAVARALVANVAVRDVVQGGSTITQQLVKNTLVGDDQTVERKLAEASLALQLESQLSKDQILEQYLNTVYFGNGTYGIGAAAQAYFGQPAADLEPHQAALLAGLLRAPANYDPYDFPDRALTRRNLVLRLMAAQDYLSEADATTAAARPLDVQPLPTDQDWRHAYAVDHVLDRLQHDPVFHVLGADPTERADRLFTTGLTIETTIDETTQVAAERSVAETLVDPASDPSAAVVAIDPATGGIRALVGGRDYHDPLDPVARFNLATDGRRQPGSSFKPIVLAAALEQGWTLDDTIAAPAAVTVPLGEGLHAWTVRNAGNRAYGDVTLRTATAFSVNTAYAQLVDVVGADAVVEMAARLGITSSLEPLQSIALGTQDVSPLEMASVSATIAAGGVLHSPQIVERIIDADGVVIWQRPDTPGEQVISPEIAGELTLALTEVVRSGTGVGADIGRPLAGKTGTSQDNADAWFTGFTPDLAAAVWIGFPQGRVAMVPPRTRVEVQGGGWPTEVFARFAVAALADQVATPFGGPQGDVVSVAVDLSRDCLPNPYTPRALIGERAYSPGTQPTQVCDQPSGPPTVDVPVVTGMAVEQARQTLGAAGFTVIEEPQFDQTVPPGRVLEQSPAPGTGQVVGETGFVATLLVSSADRTGTVVPDVLNRSLDVARQTLAEQGFRLQVEVQCPDGGRECTGASARPGVIWEQTPDVGERVPVHSQVTLFAYPA